MVATLLSAGANVAAPQANGVTPLMMAARTGSLDIVRTLLTHGAIATTVIPSTGQTALMWATAEGHLEVMAALMAAGADIHSPSRIGFTPLLFAVRKLRGSLVLIVGGRDKGLDFRPLAEVCREHRVKGIMKRFTLCA